MWLVVSGASGTFVTPLIRPAGHFSHGERGVTIHAFFTALSGQGLRTGVCVPGFLAESRSGLRAKESGARHRMTGRDACILFVVRGRGWRALQRANSQPDH